jgi:hypothetical protein
LPDPEAAIATTTRPTATIVKNHAAA